MVLTRIVQFGKFVGKRGETKRNPNALPPYSRTIRVSGTCPPPLPAYKAGGGFKFRKW